MNATPHGGGSVGQRTLHRWMTESASLAVYRRARREASGQAIALTQCYAPLAVTTLAKRGTIMCGKDPHLCLMIDLLLELEPESRFIHIDRPIEESIRSLTDRSAKARGWLRATPEQCDRLQPALSELLTPSPPLKMGAAALWLTGRAIWPRRRAERPVRTGVSDSRAGCRTNPPRSRS